MSMKYGLINGLMMAVVGIALAAEARTEAAETSFFDAHRVRVAEIEAVLPAVPAGVGLPCSERAAWQEVRDQKAVLAKADKVLAIQKPEWSDADYLSFSETGDNITGKRMMLALHRNLSVLVDAECFSWDGRYVARIADILAQLVAQKSWVVPQNDRTLENLRGERQSVDLMTASIVSKMADAIYRLGDRLPQPLRAEVVEAIERRAIQPVVQALRGEGTLPWWMSSPSNWNAACLSGLVRAGLSVLPDIETRAVLAAAAEYYSDNYLKSFSEDGYGFEGIGYWQYGFVNYARLRDQLMQSTQGEVDLFAKAPARRAALFPFHFTMGDNLYAAFGDAGFLYSPHRWALDYVRHVFGVGPVTGAARKYTAARGIPQRVADRQFGSVEVGLSSYFPSQGVLVVRSEAEDGMTLAVKAGGNLRHSHNDVGSFVIGLGGTQPLGDPGGAAYYDGLSFGPTRYARPIESSYGHPVPIIDGRNQIDATTISPKVISYSPGPDVVSITIDMSEAYDVPGLEKFHRTVAYHREGRGRVVIRDRFDVSSPMEIVESFPTHGDWERRSPEEIGFTLSGIAAVLTFDSGSPMKVTSDEVSQNGTEFRIVRAMFDVDGGSVIEMSISPEIK